tara:strand:- start:1525 stop:2784 length:1260 start_codon:yes stop_codon:yes gene_type:complete
VSTVWDELEAPFSEFIQFSQYESKGYLVEYNPENPPIFSEVKPEYNHGNCSPLESFIFFEFFTKLERDKTLKKFKETLKLLPSINSVLINMEYNGNDKHIIHPYGFSWIMFTGDFGNMTLDISKLTPKDISFEQQNLAHIVPMWEKDFPEYSLRSKILLEQVHIKQESGEYTGLALHSLNNTLATWDYSDPICNGVMFDDNLFDKDEIITLSCGLMGDHPYGFVAKTTPLRPKQFQLIRSKLNHFLTYNERWKIVANHILQDLDESDIVDIHIFNPLNILSMVNDIYKENSSKRIPSFNISVTKENGDSFGYYGSLFWTNKKIVPCPKETVLNIYGSLSAFQFTCFGNSIKDQEVSLSECLGLTYEVISSEKEIITIIDHECSYESIKQLDNLQDFLNNNDSFIDQVGALFTELNINQS